MIRRYRVKKYKDFCLRMRELEICAMEQGFEDKEWSVVFKRPVISLRRYILEQEGKSIFEYDIYGCPPELKGQLKIGDFTNGN